MESVEVDGGVCLHLGGIEKAYRDIAGKDDHGCCGRGHPLSHSKLFALYLLLLFLLSLC